MGLFHPYKWSQFVLGAHLGATKKVMIRRLARDSADGAQEDLYGPEFVGDVKRRLLRRWAKKVGRESQYILYIYIYI